MTTTLFPKPRSHILNFRLPQFTSQRPRLQESNSQFPSPRTDQHIHEIFYVMTTTPSETSSVRVTPQYFFDRKSTDSSLYISMNQPNSSATFSRSPSKPKKEPSKQHRGLHFFQHIYQDYESEFFLLFSLPFFFAPSKPQISTSTLRSSFAITSQRPATASLKYQTLKHSTNLHHNRFQASTTFLIIIRQDVHQSDNPLRMHPRRIPLDRPPRAR